MIDLGNYDVALYIEYLAKFCNVTIDETLKTSVLEYLDSDLKRDILIKDLAAVCRARYDVGKPLEEISSALSECFAYFGLNDRCNFNRIKFFIDGYVSSSIRNTVIFDASTDKVNAIGMMQQMIASFLTLQDSYYKVNIGLSILRMSYGIQLVGSISTELLQVSDYLKTYDLTDPALQNRLANIFTISY